MFCDSQTGWAAAGRAHWHRTAAFGTAAGASCVLHSWKSRNAAELGRHARGARLKRILLHAPAPAAHHLKPNADVRNVDVPTDVPTRNQRVRVADGFWLRVIGHWPCERGLPAVSNDCCVSVCKASVRGGPPTRQPEAPQATAIHRWKVA